MRTFGLISILGLFSIASADEPFSQKPSVAPSVELGNLPKQASTDSKAVLPEKFNAGPIPSWIWGANTNEDYTLTKQFDAGSATIAAN